MVGVKCILHSVVVEESMLCLLLRLKVVLLKLLASPSQLVRPAIPLFEGGAVFSYECDLRRKEGMFLYMATVMSSFILGPQTFLRMGDLSFH